MSEGSKPTSEEICGSDNKSAAIGRDRSDNWPTIELNDASVMVVNERIAQRLRLRREMLGLRQVDLAALCKMSAQQIHKYESGSSKLSSVRLIQFARVLDVRVGWFFGEDDQENDETNDFVDLLCERIHLNVLVTLSRIHCPERKEWLAQVVRTLSEDVLEEQRRDKPCTSGEQIDPIHR